MVLGSLHGQQRMGLRVVKQEQVGEHFDGPVGNVSAYEGPFKGSVLEAQDQPSVPGGCGLHGLDTGYPSPHGLAHLLEDLRVALGEVLDHQGGVVAPGRKVFGVSVFDAPPDVCSVQVGDVPALDEPADLGIRRN